jgi:hypothetical protein
MTGSSRSVRPGRPVSPRSGRGRRDVRLAYLLRSMTMAGFKRPATTTKAAARQRLWNFNLGVPIVDCTIGAGEGPSG